MTGIKREFLASQNFVMIHLSLVDYGLSWEAAALLHRIDYRSGGGGWWTVTKAQMQSDLRMSERKLDRALGELRERGLLRSERASSETSLMRWGVVYADTPPGRNVPQGSGTKRPDAEDETSRSSTKNGEKKDTSSSDDDGGSAGDGDGFEEWWAVWPRKVAKKDAAKAYAKAVKDGAVPASLLTGLRNHLPYWEYLIEQGKRDKIPHPATWLNGGRWEDEPDQPPAEEHNDDDAVEDPTAWMRRRPSGD